MATTCPTARLKIHRAIIQASTDSVTAAAAAAERVCLPTIRISITNAGGAESYPISSFTWLLIPTHSADPAKGKALAGFLTWMLDKGQSRGLDP